MKETKISVIFIAVGIIIFILFAFINEGNKSDGYVEATKENIEEFNVTNERSKINTISFQNMESSDIAKKYYNDYKFMMINYPDESFAMISKNSMTKDKYLNFREKVINNYYDYNFRSYTSYEDRENGCYVYRITDSKENVFTFKVYAVMQYEVNITL